jgi:hypothetical protein
MPYTPARLYQGQLPGTETTATPGLLPAAVPGATQWIIKQLTLCNTSGSAQTASLSLVPSGQTGGAANRLLSALALVAGQTLIYDLAQVMNSGDFLSGVASTASVVTVTISGVVVTAGTVGGGGQ